MTPERYREVDRIFQDAADLPPRDRSAFLDSACAGDQVLRREVESLLEHDTADTKLEGYVRAASASLINSEPDPERFGPYRVTGVIGRGGMGMVYSAVRDDDVYQKLVAVKLVKRGMDTEFVLARFRDERRILARLEHPNIAQVLDGGSTDDGRPYFVMEYIPGKPIHEYCEAISLPLQARLRLFLSVCSAVQYAHQKMVVHRDLKPTNILVTEDGAVKLLDFGIAKVMSPGEDGTVEHTALAMRPLTPGYASPEQVLGQPVTTATDVYSLGAVLYELLTGARAHNLEKNTEREIQEVICHRQPATPSTVATSARAKMLAGDLDNIILMALRKEPERRYATVDHLAADIRRTLENRPVLARADTIGYRTGKFVRRNRFSLAAAVVVALSLVGGIAASVWQARRAERRFEQVRKLASALIYDVHDEIRDLAGSTRARQKIVAIGLEYLGALEREASGDPSLQQDLAGAYLRIGDVQGGALESNLGDTKGALASYQKARKLLATMEVTPRTTQQVATMESKIGTALSYHGDLTGALDAFRRAQALLQPMAAGGGSEAQRQLAGVLLGIARVQGIQRDNQSALATALKALEIRQQLGASKAPEDRDALADAEAEVSMSLQRRSEPKEALPHARHALEIRLARAAENPLNVPLQRGLILSYSHVADVLGNPTMPSMGDVATAIEYYRKMTEVAERLAAADASDRRARYDLANCLLRLGSALVEVQDYQEGIADLERSASLMQAIADAEPKNNRARVSLAFLYSRIGTALLAINRAGSALESIDRGIAVGEHTLKASPDESSLVPTLVEGYSRRGLALAALGRRDESLRSGEHSMEVLQAARARQPQNQRLLFNLAEAEAMMLRIHRRLGDVTAACEWGSKADRAYEDAGKQGQTTAVDTARRDTLRREMASCR